MKEYLFYQENKKHLRVSTSGTNSDEQSPLKLTRMNSDSPNKKNSYGQPKEEEEKNQQGLKLEVLSVFSEETLQGEYEKKALAEGKEDYYVAAGFPPKICAQMVNDLFTGSKLKVDVLDIGCGKGNVGQYLRDVGFKRIYGIDSSRNLLKQAEERKNYLGLERFVFGQKQVPIESKHLGMYDFVTCNSMTNNTDFDEVVFHQMIDCVKIGGFVIFSTKLNYLNQNIYEEHISKMVADNYWNYTAEHSFYRYDKLCDKIGGKFSTKQVKVLVYQKIDREKVTAGLENEKKEELAASIQAEKMKKILEEQLRLQYLADLKLKREKMLERTSGQS